MVFTPGKSPWARAFPKLPAQQTQIPTQQGEHMYQCWAGIKKCLWVYHLVTIQCFLFEAFRVSLSMIPWLNPWSPVLTCMRKTRWMKNWIQKNKLKYWDPRDKTLFTPSWITPHVWPNSGFIWVLYFPYFMDTMIFKIKLLLFL